MSKFQCDCGYYNSYNVSPSPDEGYMFYEGHDFDVSKALIWHKCKGCKAIYIKKTHVKGSELIKYIPYDVSHTI